MVQYTITQKIHLNKENTVVLLFNKEEHKWLDRTMSILSMYSAYYHGKFTGYNIYFKGADKRFSSPSSFQEKSLYEGCKNMNEQNNDSQMLIYKSPSGDIKIDVRLDNETVWLTQKLMAELFQVSPQNIAIHLKNIYEEGELTEDATCKEFLQVQTEGNQDNRLYWCNS